MNFLPQIILAARNSNTKDWTNILFIVILAVFWTLGAVIKAKTKKSELQEGQPTRKGSAKLLQKRPVFQKRPVSRMPPTQPPPQVQPPHRKVARPQPVVQKVVPLAAYNDLKKQKAQPRHIIEPLLDFDDPGKLRKAILHYEILGRPLALRDPSERI